MGLLSRLNTVPLIHKERRSIMAPVLAEMSNLHTRLPVGPPYTDAPEGWKETALRARMYGATFEEPNSKLDKSEI